MSTTIATVKEHLAAQLHGSTLNKVRNFEALCERVANNVISRLDPIDTQRTQALVNPIHSRVYDYALPSDFKKPIDLMPQDNRASSDNASYESARSFDLRKLIEDKKISIESREGTRFLRVNWPVSPSPLTLHDMNSLTAEGTWSVVGSAANLRINEQYKISGNASIEFDLVVSGDGIQNTGMDALDLTDLDEMADAFVWGYFGSVANLTSVTGIWGNDLTTNYWTPTAQTAQADGTAFKTGWNLLKFPWSTATETGTVAPATIDSFKLTVAATGAIANIRFDNIIFSLGRIFDMKYYSKYLFRNSSGTWLSRPTSDDDTVVLDSDAINIFLLEMLIGAAQQMEAEESGFDINFAQDQLHNPKYGLYARHRAAYPTEAKKKTGHYYRPHQFRR